MDFDSRKKWVDPSIQSFSPAADEGGDEKRPRLFGPNCGESVIRYGPQCGIRTGQECLPRIGTACLPRIGTACLPRMGSPCYPRIGPACKVIPDEPLPPRR